MIYLDNAATSYPKPEAVYQATDQFFRESAANPGRSGHRLALAAGSVVNEARQRLARLFHVADPRRVVFTLNATDSLNLAIKGSLRPGDHVVTSQIEHNSVVRPLMALRKLRGIELTVVPADSTGWVDPDAIRAALRPATRLVALSHASNVSGTVQDVAAVGQIVREHGALFLVDAAQSAGVLPINAETLLIDLLAVPGHKGLYGPPGTGALVIGERADDLAPLREGGTGSRSEEQEQPRLLPDRYESGTVNTLGLAGLAAGLAWLEEQGLDSIRAHETELAARLLAGLAEIPTLTLYGRPTTDGRVAVVSLNLAGWEPQDVGAALDSSFDIAVRPGLHCAPGAHVALGNFPAGTVRLSPGAFTTAEEIDQTIAALGEIAAAV